MTLLYSKPSHGSRLIGANTTSLLGFMSSCLSCLLYPKGFSFSCSFLGHHNHIRLLATPWTLRAYVPCPFSSPGSSLMCLGWSYSAKYLRWALWKSPDFSLWTVLYPENSSCIHLLRLSAPSSQISEDAGLLSGSSSLHYNLEILSR